MRYGVCVTVGAMFVGVVKNRVGDGVGVLIRLGVGVADGVGVGYVGIGCGPGNAWYISFPT